jgi:hypothetical protein
MTGVPLWLEDGPPETAEEIWELGKAQRGVIDPETFLQSSRRWKRRNPSFRSRRRFIRRWEKLRRLFPSPVELLTDCGTTEDRARDSILPNQIHRETHGCFNGGFHGSLSTNSDGLPVITYAGSCPLGTDFVAAGHVIAMARFPFTTYVAVADGAGGWNVDAFPVNDWIEGPYEGEGLLDHDDGEQVARAVWRSVSIFEGRPQRTPDDFKIEDIAFDFQEFGTRQYYLAPARKFEGGQLVADYPLAFLESHGARGRLLKFN